ncbi:MAG: ADP-ribosylglycohydrolase family protein [Marinilabiliales bacterium]|nr:ADP-ribosylglycohydrolase family protein [Marinilabiliales bacterium]
MRGYGTHASLSGHWSDDSSLTFCLAEALTEGFDFNAIGQNFRQVAPQRLTGAPTGRYLTSGASRGVRFHGYTPGVAPEMAGDDGDWSNGNGSLMRILPLLFHIAEMPVEERYRLTRTGVGPDPQACAVSHLMLHPASSLQGTLQPGMDKSEAYKSLRTVTAGQLGSFRISDVETGTSAGS